MSDVENLEKLIAIFGGDADAAVSCQNLIQLAMMVNAVPLELAVEHLRQADTFGPIVDPTGYRASINSGRLKHNQECFGALLDFVHNVQASAARAAEQNARFESYRDPAKAVLSSTATEEASRG